MTDLNQMTTQRYFYGYTQGNLTGDSPDQEVFSVTHDYDKTMTKIYTDSQIENKFRKKMKKRVAIKKKVC